MIESEAETVRHIFQRYAALGSVRQLKEELDAAGIRSKRRTSSTGRCGPQALFSERMLATKG
jgi:hypothetical protein